MCQSRSSFRAGKSTLNSTRPQQFRNSLNSEINSSDKLIEGNISFIVAKMPSALSRSFSVPINASRFSLIAKCSDPLDPTPNNCQKVNGVSGFQFFSPVIHFFQYYIPFFFLFFYVRFRLGCHRPQFTDTQLVAVDLIN